MLCLLCGLIWLCDVSNRDCGGGDWVGMGWYGGDNDCFLALKSGGFTKKLALKRVVFLSLFVRPFSPPRWVLSSKWICLNMFLASDLEPQGRFWWLGGEKLISF